MAGMTLSEVEQTIDEPQPASGDDGDGTGDDGGTGTSNKRISGGTETRATVKEITTRVRRQVEAAYRDERFNKDLKLSMGYKSKMERALTLDGVRNQISTAEGFTGEIGRAQV